MATKRIERAKSMQIYAGWRFIDPIAKLLMLVHQKDSIF